MHSPQEYAASPSHGLLRIPPFTRARASKVIILPHQPAGAKVMLIFHHAGDVPPFTHRRAMASVAASAVATAARTITIDVVSDIV